MKASNTVMTNTEAVFTKEDKKVADRDWHYRFHPFTVEMNEKMYFENTIIDYKHYFTIPMSYLINNKNKIDLAYSGEINQNQFAVVINKTLLKSNGISI